MLWQTLTRIRDKIQVGRLFSKFPLLHEWNFCIRDWYDHQLAASFSQYQMVAQRTYYNNTFDLSTFKIKQLENFRSGIPIRRSCNNETNKSHNCVNDCRSYCIQIKGLCKEITCKSTCNYTFSKFGCRTVVLSHGSLNPFISYEICTASRTIPSNVINMPLW